MATAAFHRLGLLVRGTAGLSLTKQLDVVFAESSSLNLIKRGILPSRKAGVGKTVNGRTFIEHKLYYICGNHIKYFQVNLTLVLSEFGLIRILLFHSKQQTSYIYRFWKSQSQ